MIKKMKCQNINIVSKIKVHIAKAKTLSPVLA